MAKKRQKPKPVTHDREAVFIGRRVATDGSTLYVFELLPNRKQMLFGKVNGVSIGFTYKCSENGISKNPEWVDRPQETNPKWEVEDAVVDAINAQKRGQREREKLSKPKVNRAIEALRDLLKELPFGDFVNRKALVEFIAREASKNR